MLSHQTKRKNSLRLFPLFILATDLKFLSAACVTRLKLHAQVLDEKHRLWLGGGRRAVLILKTLYKSICRLRGSSNCSLSLSASQAFLLHTQERLPSKQPHHSPS